MREVISIHIGQGGVQIGNACWGSALTLPTPLLTLLTLRALQNLLTLRSPLNMLILPTPINLLNLPTFTPSSPYCPDYTAFLPHSAPSADSPCTLC
jgi:hypothetical protein